MTPSQKATLAPSEMPDGLFFGMPEDTYHSIPALSASGIKNLLISPADFWYRSWMNPLPVDDEDSIARLLGRAYHKRILEGKPEFEKCYAPELDNEPEWLVTADDLKAALVEIGLKPKGKKADLIAQLMIADPGVTIADVECAQYEELHKGKVLLHSKTMAKIEIAAAMIERHPFISKCFVGGFPEVSVVWTEDGLRYKSRFDYLKPRAVIDLKTFANQMNKPIDAAIYYAMAQNKYHIQSSLYLKAADQAKRFCQEFIDGDKTVFDLTDNQETSPFCEEMAHTEEHGFYFVFQQKGVAPLARAKKFERSGMYYCGIAAIEEAVTRYKACLERFGTDAPWVDDGPIESFEDERFPVFATEM